MHKQWSQPTHYSMVPYKVPSDGHLRVEMVTAQPSYAYLMNVAQATEWRLYKSCRTLDASEVALAKHVVEAFGLEPGATVFLVVTERFGAA